MSYRSQFYLVIRPISERPDAVAPLLDRLQKITTLDSATLKQRFTGAALQILMVHSKQDFLERTALALKKEGICCVVINRQDIKESISPLQATSVAIMADSLTFLSPASEVIFSLEGKKSFLIVLSSEMHKKIQGKRLSRGMLRIEEPMSAMEVISFILRHGPVMDIYPSGSIRPVRIDSLKFNFKSLGETHANSSSASFSFIMNELCKRAKAVILDTGFGENRLPFLSLHNEGTREKFLEQFTGYSRFVYCAAKRGIFNPPKERESLAKIPVIKELGGLLWGGPFLPGAATSKDRIEDEIVKKKEVDLPPPPEDSRIYRSDHVSTWGAGLQKHLEGCRHYVSMLGPPLLFYPLTILTLVSGIAAHVMERAEPLSVGAVCLGFIFFTHSLVLFKRKRIIENVPTSNIGTMPMGEVEVKGFTRPKYAIKAPHSLADCVYYSYKVFKDVRTQNGRKTVLKEWGDSGRTPFYLEDDTGKVLILPQKAIMRAGRSETIKGNVLDTLLGIKSSFRKEDGLRIVETIIPVGHFLYIMGFAHRLMISGEENKGRFIERLRALKKDKQQMRKYDIDADGVISEKEWSLAKDDLEEEMLLDQMADRKSRDEIAIGAHPTGGLFYISDDEESVVVKSMAWRIPLFFIAGVACVAGGAHYLLQLAGDKAIVDMVKKLLF